MTRYNKAIGATIGAIVAWAVAFGFEAVAALDIGVLTETMMVIGAFFGSERAPKNDE